LQDQYRGSDDERADLLKYYTRFEGDMGMVRRFSELLCLQLVLSNKEPIVTRDLLLLAGV
jgi:hypothetical protein